ncbi:ATP-binding cassette domain-containing protein [Paenibacillus sp. HJGM_3]|uniref:ATP-binding cassette domain-containing protein n=1 Tax=Paenibacillus sp. HJGM_3 TaxID=3379816 RepID=UPI00385B7142
MSTILASKHLNKSYGRTKAVRNLSMDIEVNTICGLLGRNGAGKTTLLNMLTGGIFPDTGEIVIADERLIPGASPAQTCYIREKNFFFGGATVIESLEIAAAFYPNWDWSFAQQLITAFKLNPTKKIRQLSRGMESLVANIVGLASRAPLTIYDEPVLGLDVLMREKFYKVLLQDYAEHPRTILISTHLIDEIDTVVEKVYIIEAGTIVLEDEVDNIRSQSHLLTGSNAAVSQFTEGKRVIYKEAYGKGTLVAVYDEISEHDKVEASKQGVTVDGLPLQKFFAYLIKDGGEHVE